MMLWQEKAGARYMYYIPSLAWLLEQIPLHPNLSLSLSLSLQPLPQPATASHC